MTRQRFGCTVPRDPLPPPHPARALLGVSLGTGQNLDEDDEPESVRFANVIEQTARHEAERKALRDGLADDGTDGGKGQGGGGESEGGTSAPPAVAPPSVGGEGGGEGEWARHVDDEGAPFWYRAGTGESTYDRPRSLPPEWVEAEDEEGVTYYLNTDDGRTTYDDPF